jgi:hypothetical protein
MLRQLAVAQLFFRIHPYSFYTTVSYLGAPGLYDTVVYCFLSLNFFCGHIANQDVSSCHSITFRFRKEELHHVYMYGKAIV